MEGKEENRAQELCESRGGRPGLPVPNNPYRLCGRKATLNCSISELRSCGKVEADVLDSTSLIVMVSVDVKQHLKKKKKKKKTHTSELRSCVKVEVGRPNSPYGLCGRKSRVEEEERGNCNSQKKEGRRAECRHRWPSSPGSSLLLQSLTVCSLPVHLSRSRLMRPCGDESGVGHGYFTFALQGFWHVVSA